ncbi:MAG: aryl-sulfate sulfotransferase [Deltaproteobacteria bacterium]|nr:aryl-sulfate sulfotransferase [Deltaproteobacteria bacterium]
MRPSLLACLFLCSACGSDDFEVEATVDPDVPSIVRLTWSTDQPGRSWVEFASPGEDVQRTPAGPDGLTEHEVVLLGLPFLAEAEWRAVTEVDGRALEASGTVETGGMPATFPDVRQTAWEVHETAPERFFAGTFLASSGLFVFDREAGYRWFHTFDGHQLPEFEISHQGTLLFNSFLTDHTVDSGELHEISWDGEIDDERPLVMGHHSFFEMPSGDIAYVAADVRDWYDPTLEETISVVGDQIRILPADGGESWAFFSTWDWSEPKRHDRWNSGFYGELGGDWTHANSVRYHESTDTFLLSLRNLDTILEIDGTTAEVLRAFGHLGYGFGPGSTPFSFQHDPRWTVDGTLLLLTTDERQRMSMAVEYEVDDTEQLLREVWRYQDADGVYAQHQGGVRVLSNGNRIVNFGSAGVLQEVTRDGDVVWEIRGGTGAGFGATESFSSFYTP